MSFSSAVLRNWRNGHHHPFTLATAHLNPAIKDLPPNVQHDSTVSSGNRLRFLRNPRVERVYSRNFVTPVFLGHFDSGRTTYKYLAGVLDRRRLSCKFLAEPTSPMRHRLELLGIPRRHHVRVELDEVLRRSSSTLRVLPLHRIRPLRLGRPGRRRRRTRRRRSRRRLTGRRRIRVRRAGTSGQRQPDPYDQPRHTHRRATHSASPCRSRPAVAYPQQPVTTLTGPT